MTFIAYGDKWRMHRKIMHQALHSRAVQQFHGVQARSLRAFLRRVDRAPDAFIEHLKQCVFVSCILLPDAEDVVDAVLTIRPPPPPKGLKIMFFSPLPFYS